MPQECKVEADSRPATGTGLGAGTSGFKGQALFPGTPESPASIPSPVLARLGELPILHCPANHLPPSMCLPHCVIITSASLTHFTCAQADANEAVRSWWQCTCGQLLPPPRPSTEPSPKVQGAYTSVCRGDMFCGDITKQWQACRRWGSKYHRRLQAPGKASEVV